MMAQPIVLVDASGSASRVDRTDFQSGRYKEVWLQDLLAANPFLLPAGDFGPLYDNLVCIGKEVPANHSGYIDCLFVSPAGGIVIVETKLFSNQEARRTVVAQIVDYAKEIQTWDCSTLDEISLNYFFKTTGQGFRLIDKMAGLGYLTFRDESRFTDAVNRNLSSGHVLLMIVGDGIRSNVQELADFIGANASMSFELALAEMAIYQAGDSAVVVPRLLTRTETIERNVYIPAAAKSKPRVLSKIDFINAFSDAAGIDPDLVTEFVYSLSNVEGMNIQVSPAELSFRFSLVGGDYALFALSIQNGRPSVYSMPYWVKQFLEKHGAGSAMADPFFEFMRSYLDMDRCKLPPYEHTGSYFLRIQDTLDHTDDFVAAVSDFIATLEE